MINDTQPQTYVVGAGGIGCALGYALCAAGVAVTFVEANAAKVAWGRAHGVAVDRLPPLAARFETFADWQPEAGSTVWLCTKCYDNAAVLPRLPDDIALIPVQNGFDPAVGSTRRTRRPAGPPGRADPAPLTRRGVPWRSAASRRGPRPACR